MTKLQKQLAENIRFYRKKKGMTQENLAEKWELPQTILEGLKTATKLVLLFLMRVFSKLAYQPLFLTSLRNSIFSNSKVETFFIAEN